MGTLKKIAIIVGSAAADSLNLKLARAVAELGSGVAEWEILSIAHLPMYNRDLDASPPAEWVEFRAKLDEFAGVLLTPEHNRSFPALLKNAIDVASRPYGQNKWASKPAAVVSASPGMIGGAVANNELKHVLAYLNMRTMGQPEVYFSAAHTLFDAEGNVSKEDTKKFLKGFVDAFVAWV